MIEPGCPGANDDWHIVFTVYGKGNKKIGGCTFASPYWGGMGNNYVQKLPKGDYAINVFVRRRTQTTPSEFTFQTYADKQLPCLKTSRKGACAKGFDTRRPVNLYNKNKAPKPKPVP